MDNQFNTLVQSFRDNFIEFELTGNPTYKTAYLSAKQGIDNILASMQGQVNTNQSGLNTFYSEENQAKIKQLQEAVANNQLELTSSMDQLTAAKMRAEAGPETDITPSLTNYYIAIGVMSVIIIALNIY